VRLVNLLQVSTRAEIQRMPLKEAVRASREIASAVLSGFKANADLDSLGVEVLAVTIEAIRPTPETSRALEAEAREALLRRADQAIYERRNSAVEQERLIKENELNTEIAVEEKKRQIRETKINADLAVESREQQVRESKLTGQIKLEQDRARLVAANTQNIQTEADAQAYTIAASLRPLRDLDPELLQMLAVQSTEPRLMVSMALKELAKNAAKIGNLNISPDLLNALMAKDPA
jgi:regulator of protease activity HflC (stomatin/prohibitin superfamily)